jgi:EamA domain-containing membrane protein RarD
VAGNRGHAAGLRGLALWRGADDTPFSFRRTRDRDAVRRSGLLTALPLMAFAAATRRLDLAASAC